MMPAAPAQPQMRTRRDCRLCAATTLRRIVSLGATPLANAFVRAEDRSAAQPTFPLDVHICDRCAHVQLLDVVDPELLFRDYVYVSSTSPVFVEHFREYARSMIRFARAAPGARIIEIGSNDGVLLRFFKDAGMKVLGVDPARRLAEEATRSGVETRPEFFDLDLARRLRREGWTARILAANNVFAHADDLHSIVEGVAHLLEPDGVFVFEVSYLLDVVEKTLFDTIYHEHLSYHTVKPLVGLFERHGMTLIDASRVDTHGGSLRAVAALRDGPHRPRDSVDALIAEEAGRGLHGPDAYRAFFADIQRRRDELTSVLAGLRAEGRRIAGFGAPAKATTLMYHFGLGPETLEYIVDDSPLKQGLYTPGRHIPVVPSSFLYDDRTRPDAVVVLAWNFADPIIRRHQAFRDAGGRWIVPLPRVEVL